MAVTTTTSAAVFLHPVWTKDVSDASQANVVLSTLVDRQFEASVRTLGNAVIVRDMSNPDVGFKVSGTAIPSYNAITETQQSMTIGKQAYVSFLIEDIVDVQSDIDLRSKYTDKAGYSLMATVEGHASSGLVSLFSGHSNLVGTLGADPTVDTLIDAKSNLDRADVPMTDRYIYCSPGFHNALLKIDPMTNSDYRSDAMSANENGYFVKPMYGAKMAVSNLAANNPGVAGQAYGAFSHRRGIALIIQREPQVHAQYQLLDNGWGVVVDVIYDFAERLIGPRTLGGTTSDDKFNCSLRGPA